MLATQTNATSESEKGVPGAPGPPPDEYVTMSLACNALNASDEAKAKHACTSARYHHRQCD